jgi:hypothetical protein
MTACQGLTTGAGLPRSSVAPGIKVVCPAQGAFSEFITVGGAGGQQDAVPAPMR